MRKAAFIFSRSKGHLHASLVLADALRNDFEVTYFTDNRDTDQILSQGFDHRYLAVDFKFPNYSLDLRACFPFSIDWIGNRFYRSVIRAECEEIRIALHAYRPDIIFIDAFLTSYYPVFKVACKRIVVLQSMLDLNRKRNVPPVNSAFIPKKGSAGSRFYCDLLWNADQMKRALLSRLFNFVTIGAGIRAQLRSFSRYRRLDFYSQRSFHPGLRDCPEVILSSKLIDYPWSNKQPSQLYFGPSTLLVRKRVKNKILENYISDCLERRKISGHPIIYCSLGTMPELHNRRFKLFFEKIFRLAQGRKHWNFIVSGGGQALPLAQTDNFKHFQFIPQIEILRIADVMISHGGLNSIQECIHFGVPMLILPLSEKWDQAGNAARVVFHKIGLRGKILKDSLQVTDQKLMALLVDTTFRENLRDINQAGRNLNERGHVLETIKSMVPCQGSSVSQLPEPVEEPVK